MHAPCTLIVSMQIIVNIALTDQKKITIKNTILNVFELRM